MRDVIRSVTSTLAPDGAAGIAVAVGGFLLGAFLPIAVGAVQPGVAQLLSSCGAVLILLTLAARMRDRRIAGDCVVVALPTHRWATTERVSAAIQSASRRYERYWFVPRQLPVDPADWGEVCRDVAAWYSVMLAQRRIQATSGPVVICPFMPEPMGWLLGQRLRGSSYAIIQDSVGSDEPFLAISSDCGRPHGDLEVVLEGRSVALTEPSAIGSPSHLTRPGAVVLDLGRDRGFSSDAWRDCERRNVGDLLTLQLPLEWNRSIPREQRSFEGVVEAANLEISRFVGGLHERTFADEPGVLIYLSCPISIAMALGRIIEVPGTVELLQPHGREFRTVARVT